MYIVGMKNASFPFIFNIFLHLIHKIKPMFITFVLSKHSFNITFNLLNQEKT